MWQEHVFFTLFLFSLIALYSSRVVPATAHFVSGFFQTASMNSWGSVGMMKTLVYSRRSPSFCLNASPLKASHSYAYFGAIAAVCAAGAAAAVCAAAAVSAAAVGASPSACASPAARMLFDQRVPPLCPSAVLKILYWARSSSSMTFAHSSTPADSNFLKFFSFIFFS